MMSKLRLNFHKMHGLGNDFVIIDDGEADKLTTEQIRYISNRKTGIGCDQLILCTKLNNEIAEIEMKIFNSDGSTAEFCGNATRCIVGLYINERQGFVKIKSGKKILNCEKCDNFAKVNIGKPSIEVDAIPLSRELLTNEVNLEIKTRDGFTREVTGFCLNIGNPHAVIFVDEYDFDIETSGSAIENSKYFPDRINVSFAQVVNRKQVNLRVWERGAGLTLACGSGACATFYAAFVKNLIDSEADVRFQIGNLTISIDIDGNILMKGDYNFVFRGIIELD